MFLVPLQYLLQSQGFSRSEWRGEGGGGRGVPSLRE